MKLNDIFEAEKATISGITDPGTADMFLVKMDKKSIDESYPMVMQKIDKLERVLSNLDASSPEYDNIKDAIEKLRGWLAEHPLRKMANPAGRSINRNNR